MRNVSFLIFIGTFLLIYSLLHVYLWVRIRQGWPYSEKWFLPFSILFIFLALSFVVSRFTNHSNAWWHEIMIWIGSFWLIAALYFIIAIVLIDIVRLFNLIIPFLPDKDSLAYIQIKRLTFHFILILIVTIVSWGYFNAHNTHLNKIVINTQKDLGNQPELNIVVVSDIHMGSLVGKRQIYKLKNLIKELNPDIVIFAGDLLDEARGIIFKKDVGEPLRTISSQYKTFAVPGNHEYIGGITSSEKYIKSLGIQWLKDTVARLNNHITIIGRDDLQSERMLGRKRLSLMELCNNLNPEHFNILIDHQPHNIKEVALYPIDLQISGHTHDGQFWPFNWIVRRIYLLPYGYLKIKNTHFYVSSGFGSWGPPVRLGTISEIVHIRIVQN